MEETKNIRELRGMVHFRKQTQEIKDEMRRGWRDDMVSHAREEL